VDDNEKILVNSLLKSKVKISPEATKVNGITMEVIGDALTLAELENDIFAAVKGKRLVIY